MWCRSLDDPFGREWKNLEDKIRHICDCLSQVIVSCSWSSILLQLEKNALNPISDHIQSPESLLICSNKVTIPSMAATRGASTWLRFSVQFSSVAQSCLILCDPMNRSTPGLSIHHHLLEFTQANVHPVSDAIQPSHPLSSPSPPAPNPSQHQSLFQEVNSSHEVAKVLEFQL